MSVFQIPSWVMLPATSTVCPYVVVSRTGNATAAAHAVAEEVTTVVVEPTAVVEEVAVVDVVDDVPPEVDWIGTLKVSLAARLQSPLAWTSKSETSWGLIVQE